MRDRCLLASTYGVFLALDLRIRVDRDFTHPAGKETPYVEASKPAVAHQPGPAGTI